MRWGVTLLILANSPERFWCLLIWDKFELILELFLLLESPDDTQSLVNFSKFGSDGSSGNVEVSSGFSGCIEELVDEVGVEDEKNGNQNQELWDDDRDDRQSSNHSEHTEHYLYHINLNENEPRVLSTTSLPPVSFYLFSSPPAIHSISSIS